MMKKRHERSTSITMYVVDAVLKDPVVQNSPSLFINDAPACSGLVLAENV